jgi:hypothetical protein
MTERSIMIKPVILCADLVIDLVIDIVIDLGMDSGLVSGLNSANFTSSGSVHETFAHVGPKIVYAASTTAACTWRSLRTANILTGEVKVTTSSLGCSAGRSNACRFEER